MSRKVLHIRCTGGLLGAESVVLELAQHSQAYGYQSLVCVPFDRGEPVPELVSAAKDQGIPTFALECRRRLDPLALLRLRQLVAAEAIDVVHTHGYREDIYAVLALRGVPRVATNHLWKRSSRLLRLYARLDARVLRRFDRVVAVSRPILEDMRERGVPAHKLIHIANGVDSRRFCDPPSAAAQALRQQWALAPSAQVLGMVSSLTAVKGHRFALEALARVADSYPRAHLLIVGDGPEEPALRAQARALAIDSRVRFAGRRADIPTVLAALDGFLLPSLSEGLPMAMLEALAAGLPVVASRVGDVGAVIEQGRSGLMVPPGDVQALAAAMERLLGDPARAKEMGECGAERVRTHFSSEAMTEAYCRLYDGCLRGTRQVQELRY